MAGNGIRIEWLNAFSVLPYAGMAFPSHQRALAFASRDGPYIAVGAAREGAPIGLAFGNVSGQLPEVLSLFVSKSERGQGVGTELLARLESGMGRLGARTLRCGFMDKAEQSAALVRVLRKRGWSEPVPHKLFAKFTIARMLEAPFMRAYELPPAFRIEFWRNLTAGQRAALLGECESGGWIPPSLNPFVYEPGLEERNSLVLLADERVVGWQLTQRLQPQVLTYSCSYMHPRLQRRGFIFNLYVQSVRLQARDIPEIPSACLVAPMDLDPMVAFVRRRFGPFLSEMKMIFQSIKTCVDPEDNAPAHPPPTASS